MRPSNVTRYVRVLTFVGFIVLLWMSRSCVIDRFPDAAEIAARNAKVDTLLFVEEVDDHLITAARVYSGWRTLIGDSTNSHHILVAFQVPSDMAPAAFAKQLDEAPETPVGAIALGGLEGNTKEVKVNLRPGRIFIACLSRGLNGHRHASHGEIVAVEVRAVPAATANDSAAKTASTGATTTGIPGSPQPALVEPPTGHPEIRLGDFAFLGPDTLNAGDTGVYLRNVGKEDHQMRISKLNPGKNLSDWMKDPDEASNPDNDFGMARVGPGQTAFLPLQLAAGNYVLYCLVTDPKSGNQHVKLGMMRQILVLP